MAISDLMERLAGNSDMSGTPDDVQVTAPDDLSGLDGVRGDDALTPDPRPGRRKTKAPSLVSGGPGKANAAQKKQVHDALLLLLTPATGFLAMRDPHCGGAAFAQREEIAKAMVPIICRNASMLRWFTASNAPWLDYLALLTALQPIGTAVWQHHVKKVDPYGGEPQHDYSGYTTA